MKMTRQMIKDELEKCLQGKIFCKIDREKISDDSLHGYPLAVSDELCLFYFIYDFLPDGYMIIRLKDITSVVSTDVEKLHEKMLLDEGEVKKESLISPIKDISSVAEILSVLGKNDEIVIIECEKKESFYIGKVSKLNKANTVFHHFDAMGKWEATRSRITLSNITLISLRNRYINVFSKYLNSRLS